MEKNIEEILHSLRTCLGISKHDCNDCPYFKEKKLKNAEMFHCIYHLYNDIVRSIYGSK